jgi:hypothetical protein
MTRTISGFHTEHHFDKAMSTNGSSRTHPCQDRDSMRRDKKDQYVAHDAF